MSTTPTGVNSNMGFFSRYLCQISSKILETPNEIIQCTQLRREPVDHQRNDEVVIHGQSLSRHAFENEHNWPGMTVSNTFEIGARETGRQSF